MAKRKDSDSIQIAKIRVREHVRKALLREAERNQRTLNAEIAARLEESLQRQEQQAINTAVLQALGDMRESIRSDILESVRSQISEGFRALLDPEGTGVNVAPEAWLPIARDLLKAHRKKEDGE
jgi:vacuolar-type H+-ATPase subunit E/Vma4